MGFFFLLKNEQKVKLTLKIRLTKMNSLNKKKKTKHRRRDVELDY